jgi:CIC family chloride channel protein
VERLTAPHPNDATPSEAGGLVERFVARVRRLARRFLLLTIVAIGAVCGVLAVLFHLYVELARRLLIAPALATHGIYGRLLTVFVPTIVFVSLAAIIRRFAPGAVGANLARVRMAYNRGDSTLLGARSVGATFLATPISLGAGAPLGPEGPIVVVTSGVSARIARALHLPRKLVRGMIPVGVAAGIAAVFNTPITGVVFALEEVFGSAERGLLGGVIVGAVSAAVVERTLLGGQPLLAAPFATWSGPRELIGFALIGLISGVVSGYAIAITHRLKRWWIARMPSMIARAAVAGVLIGLLGLISPSILGVGYDSVSSWLHGSGGGGDAGVTFVVKTAAFVIAISGGVLGGTFAPSLFMGAALGAAVGDTAHLLFPHMSIDPRAYALLGMGAFFAGLLRSPMAAVLIVLELTRDYDLIVPLMLAVSLSVAISRRISELSIVEQQMLDEGYVETHESGDPLAGVLVSQAMTPEPLTISSDMTILDCARIVASSRHRFFAVVEADERLVGIVTREAIDEVARAGIVQAAVRTIMVEPPLIATTRELLVDVIRRMQVNEVDRCPVIAGDASRRVVGFLSPSDILRVRMAYEQVPPGHDAFEIFD